MQNKVYISATLLGMIAGAIIFTFQNFETQAHAKEMFDIREKQFDKIVTHLETIDEKIDRVLQRLRR